MPENTPSTEKAALNLSDLAPKKNVLGGASALQSEKPPLSIPPPGFVVSSDTSISQNGASAAEDF